MSQAFIHLINDYIIDATLEASDKEIMAMAGQPGYTSMEAIDHTLHHLQSMIDDSRRARLEQHQAEFVAYKASKAERIRAAIGQRSLDDMLSDIVVAIQQPDAVPQSLSLAFREQSEVGNDDAIREIWLSMVELGLIDLNKDGD